nr:hypothetical protein [Lachnospiraceae bacterium]
TTATTDTTGTAADTTATTDTTGTTASDTTSTTDDATDSEEEVEYQEVEVESDEQQYKTSDGTIYTETELRKEKNSTKATILGLQTDIKEAEMEIEEAQKTVKECTVYATIDGYITKANTAMISSAEDLTAAAETGEDESDESEESEDTEAIITNGSDFSQTSVFTDNIVVQVSSMDGLYVDSAMSEWKLQRFGIGDVVYVLDWQSGNTYEATITYISQYASESYTQMYQEMGGSASSYYPFTAQITEDGTNLSAGDSVDISFTKPVEGSDIFEEYFEDDSEDTSDDEKEDSEEEYYILKAFVISENGKKYIYVRDENGLLEKKEISVASQTQETYRVTEGIEGDEYVAFPYGKNVRKGAKTVEGSIDDLYEE